MVCSYRPYFFGITKIGIIIFMGLPYTANGELRTKTENGQTTRYTYDVLTNLTKVELPSGKTIEYVADGNDRRIGKKVNGVLQEVYLYQGNINPVAVLNNTGEVIAQYIYASQDNVPDYIITDNATYRLITDNLGSVRLVVDINTGNIVQNLDYDAWGNILVDTSPGFQPFGFAGGHYDSDTGLTRFGARDYDPRIGRWTAQDPIGHASQDTNLYTYVYNDPVNNIDPSGLFVGAGCVAGAGINLFWQMVVEGKSLACLDWGSVAMSALEGCAGGFGLGKLLKFFKKAPKSLKKAIDCNSFTAETLVHTEDGLKPISELKVGDKVLSYDERTETTSYQPVMAVIQGEQRYQIIKLTLDSGESIEATAEHPFYIKGKGWNPANSLKVGETLQLHDGTTVVVKEIDTSIRVEKVYNLTVANTHNYFVGSDGVLVHNANRGVCYPTRKRAKEAAEHPHSGKKKPQPKKNAPRYKRHEYDEQQKYKNPERHHDSPHPENHYHDSNKSRRRNNYHRTFPKKF
jgi:RHS repeat-associated protein